MPSFRHTPALTFAVLFALVLSVGAQSASGPRRPATVTRTPAVTPRCDTGTVESKVDRFTGTTVLSTHYDVDKAVGSLSPYREGQPQLVLMASKDKDGAVAGVVLTVHKVTPLGSWQYLTCHALHFLADGEPFTPANPTHPSLQWSGDTIDSGGVSEQVRLIVTVAELGKLLSASKIEYKVCNDERELSAEDMCNARAFYWTIVASK
jgi:hypothetical protein